MLFKICQNLPYCKEKIKKKPMDSFDEMFFHFNVMMNAIYSGKSVTRMQFEDFAIALSRLKKRKEQWSIVT